MNLLTATLHRAFSSPASSSASSDHTAVSRFTSIAQQQEESRHPERSAPSAVEGPPYSVPQPHSRLRSTLHRLPPVLTLATGTVALALIGFFWLEIPDSHTWQLALSLLMAAALTAGFLALYATTIRSLRTTIDATPLWLGVALLAIWLLATWLLVHLIARLDSGISDRAGYLNSKLGPHFRVTFSYLRLVNWQQDLILILLWVVLPGLLLPFVIETVSRGFHAPPWRNAVRGLRRWQHWLAVIVLGHLGLWLTSRLTAWHPTHTVRGELISITLRLGLVYLLDLLLLVLMLAFDSELLARADTTENANSNAAP